MDLQQLAVFRSVLCELWPICGPFDGPVRAAYEFVGIWNEKSFGTLVVFPCAALTNKKRLARGNNLISQIIRLTKRTYNRRSKKKERWKIPHFVYNCESQKEKKGYRPPKSSSKSMSRKDRIPAKTEHLKDKKKKRTSTFDPNVRCLVGIWRPLSGISAGNDATDIVFFSSAMQEFNRYVHFISLRMSSLWGFSCDKNVFEQGKSR